MNATSAVLEESRHVPPWRHGLEWHADRGTILTKVKKDAVVGREKSSQDVFHSDETKDFAMLHHIPRQLKEKKCLCLGNMYFNL